MDNQQQTPQNAASSDTTAWFNDMDVPSPTPPKRSRKILLMIVGLLAALGLLGGAAVLMSVANQRTVCLTAEDFKTLTGTTLTESISPTTNFYADTISFQRGSTTYDNSNSADTQGEQLLQKIAKLYKSKSKTSIKISVSASYYTQGAAADLAQKRATAIQTSLVALGIASSDIQTAAPTYIEPEDTSNIPQDGVTTTLSIVSDQGCI